MDTRKALYLVALVGVVLLSCSEDKTTGPDPSTPFPHTTPQAATMQVDVSKLSQGVLAGNQGLCHAASYLLVSWTNAVVVLHLVIPVGAFGGCLLRQPVYLGNDTWRWTATGGAGNRAHTDELTARLLGDGEVEWSMRISGTQYELDRFLWFDGICNTDATEGDWHFYDHQSRDAQVEILRIDWTNDRIPPPDGHRSLSFESTNEDAINFGDRLLYEVDESLANMTLHDVEGDSTNTTIVEWDMETGSGMLVAARGDTCCWGDSPDYPDVDCP